MNSNVYLFALIAAATNRGMTLHSAGPDKIVFTFHEILNLEIVLIPDGSLRAQLNYYKDSNNFDFVPFNMTGEYNTNLLNVKDFDAVFIEITKHTGFYQNKSWKQLKQELLAIINPNSLVETNSELRDLVQIAPNEDQWLDGRGPIFQ